MPAEKVERIRIIPNQTRSTQPQLSDGLQPGIRTALLRMGSWPYLIKNGVYDLAIVFSTLGISLQRSLLCGCVSFSRLSVADGEGTALAPDLREGFREQCNANSK